MTGKEVKPVTTAPAVEHQSGASIRHLVPDGWHLVSDAASQVGKSVDTLRRWNREEVFVPSGHMNVGELRVSLYSDEDIKELKRVAKTIRPGRKPSNK